MKQTLQLHAKERGVTLSVLVANILWRYLLKVKNRKGLLAYEGNFNRSVGNSRNKRD